MAPDSNRDIVDAAELLVNGAEAALAQASADLALAQAEGARLPILLAALPGSQAAQLATRAGVAQVDALVLLDRLDEALLVAQAVVQHASEGCPNSMEHRVALAHLHEVHEVRHEYRAAIEGFDWLERELDAHAGTEADLKIFCAHHLISLGVKTANPFLVDKGRRRGADIRPLVSNDDEIASFLQWSGIAYVRHAEPDRAQAAFEESYSLRAPTRRRGITKDFLVADLQFAQRDEAGSLKTLNATIKRAEDAGMIRHARVGRALRNQRFG